jgi:hypothetical protein
LIEANDLAFLILSMRVELPPEQVQVGDEHPLPFEQDAVWPGLQFVVHEAPHEFVAEHAIAEVSNARVRRMPARSIFICLPSGLVTNR